MSEVVSSENKPTPEGGAPRDAAATNDAPREAAATNDAPRDTAAPAGAPRDAANRDQPRPASAGNREGGARFERRPGGPGGPSGPRPEGGRDGGRDSGGRSDRPRPRRRYYFRKRKYCKFRAEKIDFIDYKEVDLLKSFIPERGKIAPRRQTGTSAKFQRMLAVAIKRARFMALLPYRRD